MCSSPVEKNYSAQQHKQAWIAIIGLLLLLAFLLLLGEGRLLILVFPATSFAVGLFLYLRAPVLYVGFVWWMWFLGPLVRRLIDYQSGYITPGPLLFTPLIVTSISSITLVRRFPESYSQQGFPYLLCLGSILYGTFSGFIQNPVRDYLMLTFPLIWACPILFSFHLFVNWQNYPIYRQIIKRTFLWGMLVIGVYGIFQFVVAPVWDRFWLATTDLASRGIPEPFKIRVWSTMLAAQDSGTTMMASLLLLLSNPAGLIRFPAAGAAFLTMMLTRARTPWLSGLIGFLVYISSLKSSLQMRTLIVVMMLAIAIVPLTTIEPFASVIGERLETLAISNLEDDRSLTARREGYELLLDQALSELVGKGFGFKVSLEGLEETNYSLNDGAILQLLFSFGWLGSLPYLSGVLLLLFKLLPRKEMRFDPFNNAASAIVLGTFAQIGFNFMLIGSIGMLFWGFLGIGLSGIRYYWHQRLVTSQAILQNPP